MTHKRRPWPVSLSLSLSLALAALFIAPTASAQDSDDELARQHHDLATALYARGEFGAAALEFQEAYRLSSRSELLYNLYLSLRDAGQMRPAAEALRAYLGAVPDAENAAVLRARLATLDAQFAREDAGEPPADPPPLSEPPTGIEPPASGVSPVGPIVLGAGGAALIAGVVTGVLTLDARSRLDALCPDRACPPGFEGTRDEGSALAAVTDVLLIGGGVVAATGLVLTLVLPGEPSEPAVSVAFAPASISFRGSF